MPPKPTPVKKAKDGATPKSKKKSKVIVPEVRSRDSSADSITETIGTVPVVPPPVIPGISPEFMALMQMQEQIRKAKMAVMEKHRKEDLEGADLERHHQQKAHEAQMQLLQVQLEAMSHRAESSVKSSSKMPIFDMVKVEVVFLQIYFFYKRTV